MRRRVAAILGAMLLVPTLLSAAVECEGWGAVRGIRIEGELMQVQGGITVPWRGWGQIAQTSRGMVRDIRFQRGAGERTYSGRLVFNDGRSINYQQVVREVGAEGAAISFEVTANDDLDIEGVFARIAVPTAGYAKGQAELLGADRTTTGSLPAAPLMQDNHILGGDAGGLRLVSTGRCLEISTTGKHALMLQDERKYQDDTYSCSVAFHTGRLNKGQSVRGSYTLRMVATVDHSPAKLSVDPNKSLYSFNGFGGNFVFRPESPVSQYNLDHLKVAWGRVLMPLNSWEPENDNSSPAETDMARLQAHDQPGTELRNSLQIGAELQKRQIPCIVSTWPVPPWLLANPGTSAFEPGRQIAPGQWEELCESVSSYLLYAKQRYGFEPQFFSFNEPDVGVTVKLSPEEHREAIKRLGASFRKLGLTTKLLLGDTADPRKTAQYIAPTLADPAAMQYVGAIALHAYGFDAAKDYADLASTARKSGLPLLVSEVGVDAGASGYLDVLAEPWFAVDEAAVYQQLLLHAQPRALMEWEYSEDFPLLGVERSPGRVVLKLTKRFWQVRQLGNLIPPQATALAVSSDNPNVLFTAFADKAKTLYTFHLVNTGASRQVTLSGLPAGLQGLHTYVTNGSSNMYELPTSAIAQGSLQLAIPARAVVTVTNVADSLPQIAVAGNPAGAAPVAPAGLASSVPATPAIIASWDRDFEGWSIHRDNGQDQAQSIRMDAANRRLVLGMKDGCRWAITRQDASLAGRIAGRKLILDVTAPSDRPEQWLQVSIGMVGDGVAPLALPMQGVTRNGQRQTLTFDLNGVKLPENPGTFMMWIITNCQQGSSPGEIYLNELRVR